MTDVHVVSLSGGRDSAAVGIWAADEYQAGRIRELRYVWADVGSGDDGMEPGAGAWLDLYCAKVLTPRGLALDRVTAVRPGYADAWASVYERHNRRPVLPGPMFRSCTWRLKIEPIRRWRKATLKGRPVVWLVGFRADEGNEKRRVQVAKFTDPETGDRHWRPFVEQGIGLREVRRILAAAGVPEPDFYEWTTRSGCVLCFYKPRAELALAARRYPETFERMARLEEGTIAAARVAEHSPKRQAIDRQLALGAITEDQHAAALRMMTGRGASPWVTTRGGTLREIVTGVRAQGKLLPDERDCGDPLGTCAL